MTLDDLTAHSPFDPSDYLTRVGRPSTSPRCAVAGCRTRHVPRSQNTPAGHRGVCGYCRARVKQARAEAVELRG